jgi:hypothetical protein
MFTLASIAIRITVIRADFINAFALLHLRQKIFNVFNAVKNLRYAFEFFKELLSPWFDYDFTTGVGHWKPALGEGV